MRHGESCRPLLYRSLRLTHVSYIIKVVMMQIKRVYATPSKTDGTRVLVDRLWPRGLSKERAALDLWLREVAPSPALRSWFGHQPERFEEFAAKYRAELAHIPAIATLEALIAKTPKLTLLYGAIDPAVNHAVVLQQFLAGKARRA